MNFVFSDREVTAGVAGVTAQLGERWDEFVERELDAIEIERIDAATRREKDTGHFT
jgi:hypothetical protein